MSNFHDITIMSHFNSVFLSITSACGAIFLLIIGALYHQGAEILVEGKHAPPDASATAKSCFVAGFIYIGLFALSYCQSSIHSRKALEEEQRYSGI
ncbi:hypothetical protein BC833DRAFT_594441 [Globomyces pollinis-pini]|nr:hypothetical protein BC833DRAFT_594441 [Globomyces pollinis-pini]